ncbi:MAG: hypothetical protein J4478_04595 [Candidatus Diapherotrites archaeon]|uniref:Uncharacterized protein n=1 Tax=Candidatus Iainarchaeum sp. TaxID=3101447 RepID=A0A7J4KT90_9ARCH|nr:hypothetical protein [Candidatus Diapherotrites archaeon]HIH33112.1 hypothetical protein [Candidatus Diapherotrites archaeon]
MTKFFGIFEKPQSEKELLHFLKKSSIAVVITVFISAFALILMLLASDFASTLKLDFIALFALLLSMLSYFEAQHLLFQFARKKQ